MSEDTIRRLITILVENEAGALARIVGLFAQRGYNIDTLSVAPTEDSSLSRVTISSKCSDSKIEQIVKQLNRLVDVAKVQDVSGVAHIEYEVALVKVSTDGQKDKIELDRLIAIFHGDVVDVSNRHCVIMLCGTEEQTSNFIAAVSDAKLKFLEVVRSGPSAVARSHHALRI